MAEKTPIDKLDSAIKRILKDYADDLQKHVDYAAEKVGRAGVKALRAVSESTLGGTGEYARGWMSTTEQTRIGPAKVILHNENCGLPHLLENGHAKRGGGRVAGRSHIAPVEQEIIKEFEQAVKEAIQK